MVDPIKNNLFLQSAPSMMRQSSLQETYLPSLLAASDCTIDSTVCETCEWAKALNRATGYLRLSNWFCLTGSRRHVGQAANHVHDSY